MRMQFHLRFPVKKVAAELSQPTACYRYCESVRTPENAKAGTRIFDERIARFKCQAGNDINIADRPAGIGE